MKYPWLQYSVWYSIYFNLGKKPKKENLRNLGKEPKKENLKKPGEKSNKTNLEKNPEKHLRELLKNIDATVGEINENYAKTK